MVSNYPLGDWVGHGVQVRILPVVSRSLSGLKSFQQEMP